MKHWRVTVAAVAVLGGACEEHFSPGLQETPATVTLQPHIPFKKYDQLTTITTRDGRALVAVFDRDQRAEVFFDESGAEITRITPELPDSFARRDIRWCVLPVGTDSLFAFASSESRTIFLFGSDGKMQAVYTAALPVAGSLDYLLTGSDQNPMLLAKEQLVLTITRTGIYVNSKANRIGYFSTPPYVSFSPKKPAAQENTGYWPQDYRNGENFRDYYPQHCVNAKGQIVASFEANDSLFVIEDGKIVERHECKSRYMTPRHPFPDDSLGHFAYLGRFIVQEPRYRYLVYDPYRQLYYRIVHHAQQTEKPGGMEVNGYLDKPWSLMVLDGKFNVLSETVFDPQRFFPGIFPLKNGLLVQRRTNENDTSITFSVFEFPKK